MPGIFGLTKNTKSLSSQPLEVSDLSVIVKEDYHFKSNFDNNSFTLNVVAFDFMKDYQFHYEIGDLEIWVYGDPIVDGLLGEEALKTTANIMAASFPNFKKISKIDGLFNGLVWDKTKNKLFFISDRNGLAHFYYGVFNKQLVFGSELRVFINKAIKTTIDSDAVTDFLNLKYHIKNDTWFKEVQLLPPASYLEWDIESCRINSIKQYWSHKDLPQNTIKGSDKEIVEQLYQLFKKAVEKRVGTKERVGITLSGGQDSRAIFANIPKQEQGFTAITRGMKNCGDIILAKQAAKLRSDCTHIIKDMNAENWLEGRLKAIIATAGQKNLFDMNAMASLPIHKQYFDINLDGSEGALLKGEFNETMDRNRKKLKESLIPGASNTLRKISALYEEVDSAQYFFMYQNVQRFSVLGSILGHDYGIVSRFPILDNDLQEYIYGVPKNRNIGKLMNKMYLRHFPDYFKGIDSLDLGHRVYRDDRLNYVAKAFNRIREKVGAPKYRRKYHNYAKWLRENNTELLDDYLLHPDLYIYDFIGRDLIKNITETYLNTGQKADIISRLLTTSIFLEHYKSVSS